MTIAAVRSAIAAAVDTISGLRASAVVLDQINPPQAVVTRKTIDYLLDQSLGGARYAYAVNVYVSRTPERQSQATLDALCEPTGAGSLKAVVEADTALNALVDYVVVSQAGEILATSTAEGGTDYLTVEFVVEVVY